MATAFLVSDVLWQLGPVASKVSGTNGWRCVLLMLLPLPLFPLCGNLYL
jgi:hypothetical protein